MINSQGITVDWFEGSHYWEVNVDGKQVYTSQYKRDAQLFAAEFAGVMIEVFPVPEHPV